MKHYRVVTALSLKNLRVISRNPANQKSFLVASLFIAAMILFIWTSCYGQTLHYMSNKYGYSRLSVDVICEKDNFNNTVHCTPYQPINQTADGTDSSLSYLVLQLLNNKLNSPNKLHSESPMTVEKLISSLMMNGLPILGLNEYFELSDFVKEVMGNDTLQMVYSTPILNSKFGILLAAREKKIRLTPRNTLTVGFAKYLQDSTTISQNGSLEIFDSMYAAEEMCCSDVWAIIEILQSVDPQNVTEPLVTIRMHPSTIPDTRNTQWNILKQNMGTSQYLQTGQLLYLTSGFLTFQLEIQNFLTQYFEIDKNFISKNGISYVDAIKAPGQIIMEMSSAVMFANTTENLISSIKEITQKYSQSSLSPIVSLYDRAFPINGFTMNLFWHKMAMLLSIALIIFCSVVVAITAGYYCKDVTGGYLYSLVSLPDVNICHCATSFVMTTAIFSLLSCSVVGLVLLYITSFETVKVAVIALYLMSCSLGSISIILSHILERQETVVLVIPLFVFVTLLPGMLYFDLAFDVQRTWLYEYSLCLLPPSGAVLVLRLLCAVQAVGGNFSFQTTSPVSLVEVQSYLIILTLDVILYYILAMLISFSNFNHNINKNSGNHSLNVIMSLKTWIRDLLFIRNRNNYQQIESDDIEMTSTSVSPVLTIRNLSKYFDDDFGSQVILSDISADLCQGIVTSLLGANGSGKTTLLNILGGYDTKHTGCIDYSGPLKASRKRRRIGWCSQYDALYEYYTVFEHIELFMTILNAFDKENAFDYGSILDLISKLGLKAHALTYPQFLSGGTKRRLSLAMASLGDPIILLLDEVTSGCDHHTRELIRQDILKLKSRSAVLVTTHHIDDVEVMSDEVWFVLEHKLVFKGNITKIQDGNIHTSIKSYQQLIFSTNDKHIKKLFYSHFNYNFNDKHDKKPLFWNFEVGRENESQILQFLQHLEECDLTNWSIKSPDPYETLKKFYGVSENVSTEYLDLKSNHGHISELLRLRKNEVKSHSIHWFLTQIMLPFVVVFLLCLSCGNVNYPSIELTSGILGGMGEVVVGGNFSQGGLFYARKMLNENFDYKENCDSSDKLLEILSQEYYNHQRPRWESFVVNDDLQDWFLTTVRIPLTSIGLPISSIQSAFNRSRLQCKEMTDNIWCDQALSVSYKKELSEEFVLLSFHQSLRANLTLMSNVSANHATPIFLKEVATYLLHVDRSSGPTLTSRNFTFRLFSYPIEDNNLSSPAFLQRGYLGAVMVTLYVLITTAIVLRVVTMFHSSKVKLQLHLAGVSSSSYWIANFMADVVLLNCTLFVIALGIYIGGPPISNFFLQVGELPGLDFFFILLSYSCACVAANFAFSVSSMDVVTAQLFSVISAICGGLFMKLFLIQEKGDRYSVISNCLLWISPSFAFSSAVFDSFTLHTYNVQRHAGIVVANDQMYDGIIWETILILFIQAIIYLVITIVVDIYWNRVWAAIKVGVDSLNTCFLTFTDSRSSIMVNYAAVKKYYQSTSHQLEQTIMQRLNFVATSRSEQDQQTSNDDNNEVKFINFENLTLSRGTFCDQDIKMISANFRKGEKVAILETSGGGKTTLFSGLVGDEGVVPKQGHISIAGYDSLRQLWDIRKSLLLGYVPQREGLLEFLTVKQSLQLFYNLRSKSNLFQTKEPMASLLIPYKYKNYLISTLSGGNKRKLAISLANINFPSILLLDEPTTGIDPASSESIIDYLSHAVENQNIMLSSHRLDECLRICTRTLLLFDGRLLYDGSLSSFDSISKLYFQVDARICVNSKRIQTPTNDVILMVKGFLTEKIDRIFVYSPELIRFTFMKNKVNLTQVWHCFMHLVNQNMITSYRFRTMEIEEIFSLTVEELNIE